MELEISLWIAHHCTMFIVLGIVGTATLLFVWHTRDRRRVGLPLGTLGWPVLGETLEFISCGCSSHPESFMDKRRILYGKVFKSHILGRPTIISTDPEVSKVVLQNDGRVFVPSYPKSLSELMGKSSILVLSGSLHRRVHGLIGGFLKSPQLKEQMTIDIEQYVQMSMSEWKDGQTIYIQDETKKIAFQVLAKALVSLGPGDEMNYLQHEFRRFISGLISLPIKIPGTRLYRSLQAKANMARKVRRIIEERKKDTMTCNLQTRPKDLLDALLDETDDVELISDNIIDLMIPGEDSVPMLMTLAVKHLTDCPLALHKLQEENMKLKRSKEQAKERLTWSDYMSLPFTQNVITETLRMGNIIIGVIRRALQDIEIKGHLIPKGWHVLTYFRSIHLDKDFYENPYQFNPWRWQDKDANGSSFTPFGGGQRLCPGIDIARLESSIFLHHLVTGYRWEAENDSIVNFPTIQMEKRMPLKVKNINHA